MVICLILRLAPTLNETRIAEAEAEQDSAYVQGQFRLKSLQAACSRLELPADCIF